MRVPPQIVIRVADSWPFNVQDLLPSDSRFKIILFAGDVKDHHQKYKLKELADALGRKDSFLYSVQSSNKEDLVDIISVCIGKKEEVDFTDVPAFFRPHWSK